MRIVWLTLIAACALGLATDVLADPPPWAPAHGWRNKQHGQARERYYVGYSGTEYDRDFGIARGRCSREQVGAVLGGVAGGVVGSQVGSRDNRTVATIIGAAIGALIGAKIGRDMDDRDRACFGHALELGTSGRRIAWVNETSGVRYELVPAEGTREAGPACRSFTLTAASGDARVLRRGRACQSRPGVWELADR